MSTEAKLAEMRAAFVEDAGERFDHWMGNAAESPIERLFLGAMLLSGWGTPDAISFSRAYEELHAAGIERGSWVFTSDECACFCKVQAAVQLGGRGFRIDFAFVGSVITRSPEPGPFVRIAVELDGHDFHERTKAQASADKRRDRIFAANGWTVLRFTGSDVYRDPYAVVSEVVDTCNRFCWPTPPVRP